MAMTLCTFMGQYEAWGMGQVAVALFWYQQRDTDRDTRAMHIKLDEVTVATPAARNEVAGIEHRL